MISSPTPNISLSMFVPSNLTDCFKDTLCAGSNQTQYGYLGAVTVAFFILMFYALALWDRWMILKMKEQEKSRRLLEVPSKPSSRRSSYGSTLHVPGHDNFGNCSRIEGLQESRPPIRVNDRSCSPSQKASLLTPHSKH
ncbi:hypothetical protein BT96DRAFT_926004 [Gymnopus androsaceus JB14]|uniref:Uncharacterized protein n=1 Tax=Gymnopus androsaceus JB14 TaxID=1447944 RepID=A0A6A4GYV4_9AGAR|nr:hypothetical protein BT96DRAFT_926004 [Gymnopus androsaceus JB14]